jgi:hypothetical protein
MRHYIIAWEHLALKVHLKVKDDAKEFEIIMSREVFVECKCFRLWLLHLKILLRHCKPVNQPGKILSPEESMKLGILNYIISFYSFQIY